MNDTIKSMPSGDFEVHRPHRGIMTLDEIAAAERAVGGIGVSDDARRPGPTCARHWPTHSMDCQVCKDTCNRRVELSMLATERAAPVEKKHSHYFKDVSALQTVDVYRVLGLFAVVDPCLQHAVKKLLVAGGRGGGKDISRDIQEAIDTLVRWQAMRAEDVV